MHCPNCNSEIPEEAKFCPKCGFSLKNAKIPEKVAVSPNINVSPTISSNKDVNFATAINVSPVITLESGSKPEIKDEKVLERIEKLENEIERISTVASGDLRHLETKYGKEDLIRILESFRILQRIKEMANEDHTITEYMEQLNLLRKYIKEFDEELIKDLENVILRINAEISPNDIVREQKSEIRRVCSNEIDIWGAEFLKG
jgi:hypothetical protein